MLKPHEYAANCVRYIEEEIKHHLKKDGYLYLLYDPMPKSDLGASKKFSYSSFRQEIDSGYKATRQHTPEVQESCRLIYNYYNYRGPNILNVSDVGLEADDFVEQIVKKYPDSYIALYTTDMDWARYLNKNTKIINNTFDTPFSQEDFKLKYGYNPTITSVILNKAFFGDESDNITGVFQLKKTRFLFEHVDNLAKEVIENEISSSESIDDFSRRFKNYHTIEIIDKKEKSPEEKLFLALDGAMSKVNVIQYLLDNIRIIKCRCKNVDSCITYHNENEAANDLIEKVLCLKKENKKFTFGNIKISK